MDAGYPRLGQVQPRDPVHTYNKQYEQWWLIGSAADKRDSGPGFKSGISHCGQTLRTGGGTVYTVKSRGREVNLPMRAKNDNKNLKNLKNWKMIINTKTIILLIIIKVILCISQERILTDLSSACPKLLSVKKFGHTLFFIMFPLRQEAMFSVQTWMFETDKKDLISQGFDCDLCKCYITKFI